VRAVIDTNVPLSGLLWTGLPHALIEQVRGGALSLVSSPSLIAELRYVITRAKFRTALAKSNTDPQRMLAEAQLLAEIFDPPPLLKPVCRDPDDDAVLAVAIAAQVDLIITGDQDLLALRSHAGTAIVTPAQALAIVAKGTS